MIYYDSTGTGGALDAEDDDDAAEGLLGFRPHFTFARSPSKSNPTAHASAALSADRRSLKFTKAHLVFATWTIDLMRCLSIEGKVSTTRVRTDASVAEAGKEERKREVWRIER